MVVFLQLETNFLISYQVECSSSTEFWVEATMLFIVSFSFLPPSIAV